MEMSGNVARICGTKIIKEHRQIAESGNLMITIMARLSEVVLGSVIHGFVDLLTAITYPLPVETILLVFGLS
jgi:hypothetical protein